MSKVENLKKITLAIEAGTSRDTMDIVPRYPEIEFIFGIGPEGMTPFEFELVDKSEGENVWIHSQKDTFGKFFEHLNPLLMELIGGRDEVYLKVSIVSVAAADSREIVKAMAEMAAHREGGCSCGCGCSNSAA
jgi:hypothetical protein